MTVTGFAAFVLAGRPLRLLMWAALYIAGRSALILILNSEAEARLSAISVMSPARA